MALSKSEREARFRAKYPQYSKKGTSTPTSTSGTSGSTNSNYYVGGKPVSYAEYQAARSGGNLSTNDVVKSAQSLLGDAYDPNTPAPTAARLDEIASQSFINPEVKAAYETSKLSPVNQNYLAATYNATLPQTTIPTVSTQLNSGFGETDLSQTSETQVTSPGDALAFNFGQGTAADLERQKLEAQLALYTQRQDEQKGILDRLLASGERAADAYESSVEEMNRLRLEELDKQEAIRSEITALEKQYADTLAARDTQIQESYGKMASMNFINNQVQQIKNNAAPELNRLSAHINALAAQEAAMTADYERAQGFLQKAVEASVAAEKMRYDNLITVYNYNEANFDRIESIYKDAYDAQIQLAKEDYERKYEEKQQIANLALDYPNAGIDIYSDTWEDAYRKASNSPTALTGGDGEGLPGGGDILTLNQIEQFRRSYGWTPPYGFTEQQLLQFMEDNPTATPEELEAGANQLMAELRGATTTTQTNGSSATPTDVISTILTTMTSAQKTALKAKADAAGVSEWWRYKTFDIKDYLNSIQDKIQEAINLGYNTEEIIEYLTS